MCFMIYKKPPQQSGLVTIDIPYSGLFFVGLIIRESVQKMVSTIQMFRFLCIKLLKPESCEI